MKGLLCIYKANKLQYTTLCTAEQPSTAPQHTIEHTAEPNPLLYNIVKGFIDVADRSYKDTPRLIKIGDCSISILSRDDTVIFAVDSRIHNLDGVAEKYDNGDIEGIRGKFTED